ncbi:MAG: 6-bladed beta-propeller [Candidatus Tectimicrobiota bacterium]
MSPQGATAGISLTYVKTIGIVNNGSNGRGFANPYAVAVSRDGRIFVLNRCDPARAAAIRVGICTLDETYLGEFGKGFGTGDGQFAWPVAMAFDSQERLYITDEYQHRVSVFDSTGTFLSKWGVPGSGPGELHGPAGIAFDAEDQVYLVDQHNNRVQKFTADGRFLLQWGSAGAGEGQFNLPWGIAVDTQGQVYVADWRNDRIQQFTAEGRFLASFGTSGQGEGQLRRPSGVAVDAEGYIYVADWGNERVQVLGPDGSFQLLLRGQATLSKWAEEYFASNPEEWEARLASNLMPALPAHLNTPYHISSQTEPYFWGPVSVTLDHEQRLYVPETNRHRVQIYQKN